MTLKASALACDRNGRVVFSGLSFEVPEGHCAQLRGPNGSGKSSLLRLIAGLLLPSHGEVSFAGHQGAAIAQQVHFIAHQDAMKSALTVSENLEFWSAMLDGGSIASALSAFALEPLRHEQAAILSAGQRRRLALSRLFLARRPLWLLDEPATALDSDTVKVLDGHLADHLAAGGTIVLASHDDHLKVKSETISLSGLAP